MNEERRESQRFSAKRKVNMELMFSDDDGVTHRLHCITLDISKTGLRVSLEQELPIGFVAQLCIENDQGQLLLLFAELRWCKRSGVEYECGFELMDTEQSDLSAWVDGDLFQ
ncbi:MAG: PilZ domain-containing protein [Gammaproteobacteria bacterium]|nr:PilZ domain-containing protein [Gammaproteobacteria bacterium]